MHRPPSPRRRLPLLALVTLFAAVACDTAPPAAVTAPTPPPPPPGVEGRWAGSFDMSEVAIGGILPLEAHVVDLSLTLSQTDQKVEGMGTVTGLMGKLAPLAFVNGPQRGTVTGLVVDGVAELSLDIPPFGAPPAAAAIIFQGAPTAEGLVGTCHASLAGSSSTPVPCTLGKVSAPTQAPASGG